MGRPKLGGGEVLADLRTDKEESEKGGRKKGELDGLCVDVDLVVEFCSLMSVMI